MSHALLLAVLTPALLSAQAAPARTAPARPRTEQRSTPSAEAAFERIRTQADAARSAERMDEAISLYRKGVALKPSWTEGWWYLATLLYDRDNYADARDAFRRYVRLDRKSGPGYALLGLCLFQTSEYAESLSSLRQADTLGFGGNDQMREVAHYHLGMLFTRFRQYDAALQLYMRYAERGMDRPSLIEAAGIAALRRPLFPGEVRPEEHELVMATGAAVWDIGAHRNTAAEEKLKALVVRYPDVPNLHYTYGSFLVQTQPEQGLRELLRELEISPDHVPCLIQTALEYLKRGETEKALPYAQKAVKLEPESFVAHNALGRILVEADKVPEGIKELEKALSIAPDSAQTHFALGAAYRNVGRTAEASKEMAEFERLKKEIEEKKKQQPL